MRVLFQVILPIVLPTLIYLMWLAAERRRVERIGRGEAPTLAEAPWVWLALGGVLLAALVLAAVTLMEGENIDGIYVPPRVGPDGQIVPGHMAPRPQ